MRSAFACLFGLCVFSSVAIPASAQGSANPISDGIRSQWDGAKKNIKESAALVPDANWNYRPVDGVRTFGEILAHVAGASYQICAAAKGEKTPFAEDYFEKNAKSRADVVKATGDAIAYCDGVFSAMTDATAAQMVQNPFGEGKVARSTVLVIQIGHDNEHYGNLVTYFRMNGIVPPSSRR